MTEFQNQYDRAVELQKAQPQEAIPIFLELINNDRVNDEKVKEQAIYQLGELFALLGRAEDLRSLLRNIRPFFAQIAKAKTAKIVRTLIDLISKIPDTTELQIELCKESIEWTKQEKRTFLRQRIETKLAALYLQTQQYSAGLNLLTNLLREVKRLDDKLLLVEIQLLESQLHFALRNLPKAKAALTSARTSANSIYCPPALQASIDMQAGTLHAEEKDYKTAYSYFIEAFEGYNTLEQPEKAVQNLKYMLLCKIMLNSLEDIQGVVSGKLALKYSGRSLEAMKAIAAAHKDRSLSQFERLKTEYSDQLELDALIRGHLSELYDTLLEQNLIRLIEPFSCVEISHVSKLIDLPVALVERKLSQMILDKKLFGILDQGNNCLIVFEDPLSNKTYPAALQTITEVGRVVDSLYEKARKIH